MLDSVTILFSDFINLPIVEAYRNKRIKMRIRKRRGEDRRKGREGEIKMRDFGLQILRNWVGPLVFIESLRVLFCFVLFFWQY
jgi:hypothetical protein